MGTLHVALLQMTASGNDQQANLEKGDAFCRRARAMGADLALFPEMWNIGYTGFEGLPTSDDPEAELWMAPERWRNAPAPAPAEEAARDEARARWQAQAIGHSDPYVAHFRRLARELDMAIALTYLERQPGAPRNVVSLISSYGELVFTYAKVHTCAFSEPEASLAPGEAFCVAPLETRAGTVQVGAMICFDREFPESARVLMLQGAELVLVPNACGLEERRLAQVRTRAYENMLGVAVTNYAAPQENGHSCAFGADGMLVVQAGEAEDIYLAPFDLERLRDYRSREVWGNAFRRPRAYAALTAPEVRPPFTRINRHGEPYERS
jgi:N-carbamoylputrescine amidase